MNQPPNLYGSVIWFMVLPQTDCNGEMDGVFIVESLKRTWEFPETNHECFLSSNLSNPSCNLNFCVVLILVYDIVNSGCLSLCKK